MEDSILISTKKALGLSAEYTPFDLDIIMHINAVFSILKQLGVGPAAGFTIEDNQSKWQDFLLTDQSILNMTKTYLYLKVRALFDPPSTPHHATAMKTLTDEYEWRLNQLREEVTPWTAPTI
jgi:hypothetical protein